MNEIILQIPIEGLIGYSCSNFGNIYSYKVYHEGKLMSPQLDRDGYLSITFLDNGILRKFQIHRLVAITFLDNICSYEYVNHKNCIRNDNRLTNLEYCSSSYNSIYSYITFNRNQVGENNNTSVLSDTQAMEIYILATNKTKTTKEISIEYKVSESTVRSIKNGLRYNSVTKHKLVPIMKNITNNEHNSVIKQELLHLFIG